MPQDLFSLILNIFFYVMVGAYALLSALAIYIVIKYGRTPAITSLASITYAGVFLFVLVGAFITLQVTN